MFEGEVMSEGRLIIRECAPNRSGFRAGALVTVGFGLVCVGGWICVGVLGTKAVAADPPATKPDQSPTKSTIKLPSRYPDAAAYRPTPIPDRIILTWSGEPSTTQAVTWRTSEDVTRGLGQITLALDNGRDMLPAARTEDARTTILESDLGKAAYHSVEFQGLKPSTLYAYRVGDGENWSEWSHFRTAEDPRSTNHEPFSFVYFGDAQNDIKSLWSRIIRQAYSDAPKTRFLIHAGDLVNTSNSDALWGEWFGAGGWINQNIPSVPVPGNHEYIRPRDAQGKTIPNTKGRLTRHWRPQFALPTHGPEGLEETAYYFDFQGVRFVALNSNDRQEEQAKWLDRVLRERPETSPWTILTFHHPIYSTAKGRDNAELRKLWQPIFDQHGVDLVLQGHDHTYARMGPRLAENLPSGLSVRDQHRGTVYVVSVSGPKMYFLEREPVMARAAEDTQMFQVVTVDGPSLRYEARTATGTLYDAFELRKRPGQPSEFIEKAPKTPERLRPSKPKPAEVKAAAAGTR
jgi:3',5'-cyclic AMP phosphodiesterase CpdA